MDSDHTHSSHADVQRRLSRAEGHLRAVSEMIADGRGCLDVAQQLQAVESAIRNAKRALIHDHIDHCLSDGSEDSRAEVKAISKYL